MSSNATTTSASIAEMLQIVKDFDAMFPKSSRVVLVRASAGVIDRLRKLSHEIAGDANEVFGSLSTKPAACFGGSFGLRIEQDDKLLPMSFVFEFADGDEELHLPGGVKVRRKKEVTA
jgi:hypothetical protein